MARKKKAPPESAGSPWMNTFSDLMNLLLCFFVLLFSMSNVDAGKYEDFSKSMSKSFSIYDSGSSAIEEGRVISTGIYKMPNLDEHSDDDGSGEGGVKETPSDDTVLEGTQGIIDELHELNKEATTEIYEEVSGAAHKFDIYDEVNLDIDPNYRFVKITLDGYILFDSGKADIKQEAYPLMNKLGDILNGFDDGEIIEIEGHTDNVPIGASSYESNELLSSARAINAATYLIEEKGIDPTYLKWSGRGEYDPVTTNTTSEGRAKNRRIEIKVYNNIE